MIYKIAWWHDDIIKWKHFPRNWLFVHGIHRFPLISPHKGQWRGALMFSSICVWINDWVNNRAAGHLRRYRAHYNVIKWYMAEVLKQFPLFTSVHRHVREMTLAKSSIIGFLCKLSEEINQKFQVEEKEPRYYCAALSYFSFNRHD